jgi:hypothetical protein
MDGAGHLRLEAWDDIARLAASIKAGTVAPSTMLEEAQRL